jgi:RNA polymerase primary sigma factor
MKTHEEDRSTRLLIEETKKFKILGRDAERKLFEEYNRIKDFRRKQEIKAAIVQSYLRFVLAVAKSYKKQNGLPINDFYAEGKLALLEAFEKFDYKTGTKFGSFAAYEVKRHMNMIVNNCDMVRVPVKTRHDVLDAKKNGEAVDKFKYGVLADNAIRETTSFSAYVGNDNDHGDCHMTVGDTIAASDQTDSQHGEDLLRDTLRNVMEDNLSAEENNLLRRLYGLDGYEDTVSEISSERRVSKELIRRMRTKALAKLRGLHEVAELRASCGT